MPITIPIVASPSGAQSTVTLPDPVVAQPQTTFNIGESAVLGGDDSGNGNLLLAQQANLSTSATLQSLSFYVTTAAGQLYLGVYDASGPNGGPGQLKASTGVFTPVAGWNTKPVIAPVALAAGTYWLAYHPSSSSLGFRVGYETGTFRYYGRTFGALPTTFSTTPVTGSGRWSLYATVMSGGPPPPPDTSSPSQPANFVGTPFNTSVALSWQASTDNVGVTHYLLTRNGAQIASVAGTTYNDAGLSPSTSYIYTVRAVDAAGNQSTAATRTVTTTNVTPPTPGLPPLWNASPPTGLSPAPAGPIVGQPGQFDTGPLAQNEVWDHFSGTAGSNPDSRLWLEDTINQGGAQVYDTAQTFLDGNGNLVFEGIRLGAGNYRSGRLTSRTKFNMKYGWLAARIKFPSDPGFFPAFWTLFIGLNTGSPYGEIDIMEFFGAATNYNTHIHFGGAATALSSQKDVPASHGENAANGFHTYWMMWESDRIRIGVDDLIMGDWTAQSLDNPAAWVAMQQPHYFIWNFAIHPSWLPAPAASSFPARMLTDWIWYKPL